MDTSAPGRYHGAMKTPQLHQLLLPVILGLLGSCASTSSITVYGGERSFDDFDDDVIDDQTTFGVEFLMGILPWGLGLEFGVNYSEDDAKIDFGGGTGKLEGTTFEGYVGARKTFREEHRLRPYIGAGFSYILQDFEFDGGGSFDDDDGTGGLYGRVGVGYHFAVFHFGVDYRVLTQTEVDFGGSEVDLDHGLLSVFAGLSF